MGEAVGRLQRQIGGRHAKLATELAAGRDSPFDQIVATEPARCRLDVALFERAADGRRGDDFALAAFVDLDFVDDLDPKSRAGRWQGESRKVRRFRSPRWRPK